MGIKQKYKGESPICYKHITLYCAKNLLVLSLLNWIIIMEISCRLGLNEIRISLSEYFLNFCFQKAMEHACFKFWLLHVEWSLPPTFSKQKYRKKIMWWFLIFFFLFLNFLLVPSCRRQTEKNFSVYAFVSMGDH